jgi:hypothetical protein
MVVLAVGQVLARSLEQPQLIKDSTVVLVREVGVIILQHFKRAAVAVLAKLAIPTELVMVVMALLLL